MSRGMWIACLIWTVLAVAGERLIPVATANIQWTQHEQTTDVAHSVVLEYRCDMIRFLDHFIERNKPGLFGELGPLGCYDNSTCVCVFFWRKTHCEVLHRANWSFPWTTPLVTEATNSTICASGNATTEELWITVKADLKLKLQKTFCNEETRMRTLRYARPNSQPVSFLVLSQDLNTRQEMHVWWIAFVIEQLGLRKHRLWTSKRFHRSWLDSKSKAQ